MNASFFTYHRERVILFSRAAEPFGELGNMAGGFPLYVGGYEPIWTSEALFQALRFPDYPEIQQEILAAKSGYSAKCAAKKDGRRNHQSRSDWDAMCRDIMRFCITLKLAQHLDHLAALLLSTGERPLVEKAPLRSESGLFWGTYPTKTNPDRLEGYNHLGRLWMELRARLVAEGRAAFSVVVPPAIDNLCLLRRKIPAIIEARPPWTQESSNTSDVRVTYTDDPIGVGGESWR